MGASFTALDWSIVIAILVGTTVLGERLAGRQRSVRDFFLGGRSLPWFAVAASIVATEISAVTYISLPSVVYRDGGNLHYLQIVLIGSLLARLFVGYVLVPAYYEREIYSPYDYVAQRLGERARGMTTALFTLGGILGQSARVYLTALVLEVLLAEELAMLGGWTGCAPLTCAVALIGVVAVLWTWIGGIATVIWTDVVLFCLFLVGIAVSLWTVHHALVGVGGGLSEALVEGWRAGKFDVINTSTDLSQPYTLWVALFVASWGQIGPYGCDQLMAQRLFCCRGPREARKAIVASIAAVGIIAAVALVGVALWAYYQQFPLSETSAALVAERPDRIFPIFVMEVVGPGLKGLVIVGALAAAISSLDSILAALSQTTLATVYLPRRRRELARRGVSEEEDDPEEDARTLRVSRSLVLGWGVVLCAAAVGVDRVADRYDSLLDLALAMAGYTGGALLGAFFLAFLPMRARGRGLLWSAPLSVLAVFALAWHEPWALDVVHGGSGLLGLAWVARMVKGDFDLRGTLALLLGLVAVECLCRYGALPGGDSLPWPWYVPLGSVVTFAWALGMDQGSEPQDRAT
jgi:SSS family transporter